MAPDFQLVVPSECCFTQKYDQKGAIECPKATFTWAKHADSKEAASVSARRRPAAESGVACTALTAPAECRFVSELLTGDLTYRWWIANHGAFTVRCIELEGRSLDFPTRLKAIGSKLN